MNVRNEQHTMEPASVGSRRRWPKIAVATGCGLTLGVVAVAVAGTALGTGPLAGESAESQAVKVLRADNGDLVASVHRLSTARQVADLQGVGEASRVTADRLRARDAALIRIDDDAVQSTAQRAHRATIRALEGIGELSAVNPRHLDAWDEGERQVVSSLGELDAVAAPVAALDQRAPVRIETREVDAAVEHASGYLTTAAHKLAGYEKRMARFRRKNRKQLQATSDYRSSVQAQMAAYSETRSELQDYLDEVKDFGERIPVRRRHDPAN